MQCSASGLFPLACSHFVERRERLPCRCTDTEEPQRLSVCTCDTALFATHCSLGTGLLLRFNCLPCLHGRSYHLPSDKQVLLLISGPHAQYVGCLLRGRPPRLRLRLQPPTRRRPRALYWRMRPTTWTPTSTMSGVCATYRHGSCPDPSGSDVVGSVTCPVSGACITSRHRPGPDSRSSA